MFGKSVQSPEKSEKVTSVRRAKPEPVGRDRLKHLDAETNKAKEAVAEFEQRVRRLEQIVSDADVTNRALQTAIAADGGVALEKYATGNAPGDSEIAGLVLMAEQSTRAATAAKAARPAAQAQLEDVRMQVIALSEGRVAELNRVISMMADEECRAYKRAFENLGRRHDRLVGYASVAEMNQGDIRLTQAPLAIPRFSSPSLGGIDSDTMLRHVVNQLDIGEAARMWGNIRARLEQDAGADVSDLMLGVLK
jgi:hypothetical protein